MIELIRGKNRLTLLPQTGASIGSWQHDGKDVFLPVSNPSLRAQNGVAVAAYPLIPYSNRIADGRFSFEGQEYQLADNLTGEPHAIHGNAWEHEWTVAHQGPDYAILTFDHTPVENDREWPFAYRAVISYVLRNDVLEVQIAVENRDQCDQPVGFGFHPFLAASGEATLAFDASSVWRTTPDNLPLRREPCEGEWAFEKPVDAHARVIDNCFAGFAGSVAFRHVAAGLGIDIDADRIFQHVVVYTAPGEQFVAVEPVTNMTDAINHPEIADRGLHILKPGTRIGGGMRFRVSSLNG
ncbi:aldose 1-epimerase [Gluconobacter wancherniae]|uniref:Epimerase n=1 Tax=Gluconobacter wancherniae NBRC 103581 TaxID=656744 RepID=A0A511AWZ3_9PROT|nr:aldose 1-epimerase [Gluconobacter wancherniae]MBF0852920.1 aldose 1-epimerase [Gluconobacter wancherniae]MBS1093489.1 aldose 1-epimerase [Gluconobacter wancherniae]GBD56364.1 aldose 1-epimerase [Gluconobacter wancherniae NBRC 103581]GBR63729.1 aldose 1-epimerase [Gluconobacter wancherniae NBRC 103581]GEK92735.1 epimerase [Gluconobacter wancherniae NBRC 103581]